VRNYLPFDHFRVAKLNTPNGSISDILNSCAERPLLRVKQTSNVRYSELAALVSAFGGRAVVTCQGLSGPYIANFGDCQAGG